MNLKELQQTAARVYKPGSVLYYLALTQAIHESGLFRPQGPSQLASKYKNLFGIKGDGDEGHVLLPTWEVIKGKTIKVKAKFAHYSSYEMSFEYHKRLMNRFRYRKVRQADNVIDAFQEVYKAGYATDPKYPEKLMRIYKKYLKDTNNDSNY